MVRTWLGQEIANLCDAYKVGIETRETIPHMFSGDGWHLLCGLSSPLHMYVHLEVGRNRFILIHWMWIALVAKGWRKPLSRSTFLERCTFATIFPLAAVSWRLVVIMPFLWVDFASGIGLGKRPENLGPCLFFTPLHNIEVPCSWTLQSIELLLHDSSSCFDLTFRVVSVLLSNRIRRPPHGHPGRRRVHVQRLRRVHRVESQEHELRPASTDGAPQQWSLGQLTSHRLHGICVKGKRIRHRAGRSDIDSYSKCWPMTNADDQWTTLWRQLTEVVKCLCTGYKCMTFSVHRTARH